MALFNNLVAIGVTCVALIPLFFVKREVARIVVILIAVGCFFGARNLSQTYLYPQYLGWQFEHEIKQQPLFRLIAEKHPKEFNDFMNKAKESLHTQPDFDKIAAYSSQLLNEIFFQHLKNAPDVAVNNYLKATLELYRYLATKDPRIIIKFENENNAEKLDMSEVWSDTTFQQLLSRLLEAKQQVITLAIQQPVTPPTQAQAEPLLHAVLTVLTNKYGKEAVHTMFSKDQKNVDPAVLAGFIIDFYSGISEAGSEKSGIIMRYIGNLKVPAQQQPQ